MSSKFVRIVLAAGAAIVLISSTPTRARAHGGGIRNIVFVHGAWADGSSWSKVIPLLERDGLHTISVQNPLSSLADDVAATKRAIANQDGPVILVGHSYGGTVITEAGSDPNVSAVVYVAAFAPDRGQSTFDAGAGFQAPGLAEIRVDPFGFLTLTPNGIRDDFAEDLSEKEKTVLISTQGPTSLAALSTPVDAVAWKLKPTWYIVAEHDRMINPDLERLFADRMNATTIEIPSSHVPMLSHPLEVAAFISKAAAGGSE